MEWTEDGIILSARPHGEGAGVVELLTAGHGRHLGLVHGLRGLKSRGAGEPGALVMARWRARVDSQLGTFTLEPITAYAARVLDDPRALTALSAVTATLTVLLPEREPQPGVRDGLEILLKALTAPEVWPAVYVRFELGLLESLGHGLDLGRCALTGTDEDLTHVSPRTGRAVSRAAAGPYLDKLLPLPPFLLGRQAGVRSADEMRAGFALTGHFLAKWAFEPHGRSLPQARMRLEAMLSEASQQD